MSENVSKFIKFKGGKRVRPYLVAQIDFNNDGLVFLDSEGNEFGTIPCPPEHREHLSDLYDEALSKKDFVQPELPTMNGKAAK